MSSGRILPTRRLSGSVLDTDTRLLCSSPRALPWHLPREDPMGWYDRPGPSRTPGAGEEAHMARVRSIRAAAVVASLGLLVAANSIPAGAQSPAPSTFPPGTTVNLLTFNGPQVAEPLIRRAPDFEKADRHPRQCHRGALPGHLHQGHPGRVDGQQRLRRLRLQPAVVRRLRGARLPRGPDRPIAADPSIQWDDIAPVLPRLQRVVRRQDLRRPAGRRLPHGLLPQGPARQGRHRRPQDLG